MKCSLFFLAIVFLSCNSSSVSDFKKHSSDTVLTTIQYAHNWATSDYRTVTSQKIIKDTFTLKSLDSITQKKTWTRDSFYIIGLVDTMRDAKGVVRDSTGKAKLQSRFIYCPKEFIIQDYNKNWKPN